MRWEVGLRNRVRGGLFWHAHSCLFSNVNVASLADIFSPRNCAGDKHICSCQSVSLPSFHSSPALSVDFCHFPFINLFLLCFVFALPATASSEAPESLCLFGCFQAVWFQPLVSLVRRSDKQSPRDSLHSSHLHASQLFHRLWSMLKHAVNNSSLWTASAELSRVEDKP